MIKKIINWFKSLFTKEKSKYEEILEEQLGSFIEVKEKEDKKVELPNDGDLIPDPGFKSEELFCEEVKKVKPKEEEPVIDIPVKEEKVPEIPLKFRIIISYRNESMWVRQCLKSVLIQNADFTAHFLDDNSHDSYSIPDDDRLEYIKRKERLWALENQVQRLIVGDFDDEDIIVFLDGDDKLLPRALEKIGKIYKEENCLVCYGQYENSGGSKGRSSAYTEEEFSDLRNHSFRSSHVRTFKYKLFKDLIEQDPNLLCFRDNDGEFYKMTGDIAMMFPILEIAGYENVYFNDEPVYWYRSHVNNDIALNAQLQKSIEEKIRTKRSFKCLYKQII